MSDLSVSKSTNDKGKTSWSRRISSKNMTKEITVEEVENGYLVRVTREGQNEDGEWEYREKKYISEDNPIEDDEQEMSMMESINSILSNIDGKEL